MIVTEEMLEQGKSRRGGWSYVQTALFGVDQKVKGWKWDIIGKDFPEHIIQKFLAMKDAHLRGGKAKQKFRTTWTTILGNFQLTYVAHKLTDEQAEAAWNEMVARLKAPSVKVDIQPSRVVIPASTGDPLRDFLFATDGL